MSKLLENLNLTFSDVVQIMAGVVALTAIYFSLVNKIESLELTVQTEKKIATLEIDIKISEIHRKMDAMVGSRIPTLEERVSQISQSMQKNEELLLEQQRLTIEALEEIRRDRR